MKVRSASGPTRRSTIQPRSGFPAYHPDTPEVRQDWAQYYDNLTEMDRIAGQRLQELEEAGLADETIVFYYGDHGPGMPRCKRWPYNSGLRVPLIVSIPEKFRHLAPKDYTPGGKTDRLVSFVDLAPTLVSLVGAKPPEWMQGHAFLGALDAGPQPYIYGFRGRMDERYDLVRSVRDQRYVYLRQYMPHRIYGQHVSYMFQTPTTQVWKRLFDEGKLAPEQRAFWEPKPAEELYDLASDPDEVRNLADSPEHREILERMRKALRDWELRVRDVGFLPESEIHSRSEGSTPYEIGHDRAYPLERILDMAEAASSRKAEALPKLKEGFQDQDSAVRYWAATGILIRGVDGLAAARGELREALADPAPSVRVVAAEALARYGDPAELREALAVLTDLVSEKYDALVSLAALNALDELDAKADPAWPAVRQAGKAKRKAPPRTGGYIPRVIEKIEADRKP